MATLFESKLPNLHALSVSEAVSDKAHQDSMDEDKVVEQAHNSATDDLDSVSKIHKTRQYIRIMQMAEKMPELFSTRGIVLEEEAGLQLIADCFVLRAGITLDIVRLYDFILGKYHSRFPKLELSVPLESYARVVKRAGNEMDLTLVDLDGVLSPTTISFLKKTSIPSGKPLPDEVLQKVFDACDRLVVLSSAGRAVDALVDKIAEYIAPNLFALLGSYITTKLIMRSGGLLALASIPGDNFSLLGPKNITNLKRFLAEMPQFDLLEDTDFVSRVRPGLEFSVYRSVAKGTTVAACIDRMKEDPTGKTGRRLRDEIFMKIERWNKEPYYGEYEKKYKRREDPLSKLKQKKRNATMRKMLKIKELIEVERMGIVAHKEGCHKLVVHKFHRPSAAHESNCHANVSKEKYYGSSGALPATSGLAE